MRSMKQDPRIIASALNRLQKLTVQEAFDPLMPDSKPTKAQQEILDDFGRYSQQWLVAGNRSGKSQTCARLTAWVLEESHPKWKRPAAWNREPLLILVAVRSSKHIEETILPKITSYLTEGTYKIVRTGNITQRLEHVNGNRVVFQSLENPQQARERLQSYSAHLTWVDEMPPTSSIIGELTTRSFDRGGYFLASFTPLNFNPTIKKMVDAVQPPIGKKYQLFMLDNPRMQDPERQKQILQSMAHLSEAERNARLYGQWISPETAVYHFDADTMVRAPENYSPAWRHVEVVDPAMRTTGYSLLAEEPSTGNWFVIKSEYIKNVLVPEHLVQEVAKRSWGVNLVRRIYDPHETWYIQTAQYKGYPGMTPLKHNKKQDFIKNLQAALGSFLYVSPWCLDLQEEFASCQWSDRAEGKIVSSSDYHLLDTLQYFVELKPAYDPMKAPLPWHAALHVGNEVRKKQEKREKQLSTAWGRKIRPIKAWRKAR